MDLVQPCSQLTINKIRTVFESEKHCLFQAYFTAKYGEMAIAVRESTKENKNF